MLGVNVGVAPPVAWFPFAGWKDSFEVERGSPIQPPAATASLHSIAARRGTEAVKRDAL